MYALHNAYSEPHGDEDCMMCEREKYFSEKGKLLVALGENLYDRAIQKMELLILILRISPSKPSIDRVI